MAQSKIFVNFYKCLQGVVHSVHLIPYNPITNFQRGIASSQKFFSKKTVIYDYHVTNEGKMVDFANYLMPVQYGKVGIASSHKHVRSQCGLFDVSHMLQSKIHGKDKINFMESLIVGDIQGLKDNTGTLSLFTNDKGGIIDDLICSKVNSEGKEYLYVVSNAGCREKDLKLMQEKIAEFKSKGKDVEIEVLDKALIALQGPKAAPVLKNLTKFDLDKLHFMNTTEVQLLGAQCRVTRCGYTGEDGFEISVPNDKVVELCQTLIDSSNGVVQLAGLGARDSLRLEAGLCLYGNDIDDDTTPIEAVLAWTIGKRRRDTADFPGAEIILRQLKEKPSRKRIGLVSHGPPPRSSCQVLADDGKVLGEGRLPEVTPMYQRKKKLARETAAKRANPPISETSYCKSIAKITSGCPSPSLGSNVAMAYVPSTYSKPGTELKVQVRNKLIPATVTKMPFIKCNYYN